MFKYWVKNRILLDVLVPVLLVIVTTVAFITPMFRNLGEARLMVSLYENEKLNFDVPSPSFDQVSQLESESSITSVFPYFYTKANLYIDGKARETNLFFSDAFDKLDQTMYDEPRLIEASKQDYSNPILVDYQFVQDTGVKIGSRISVSLGSAKIEFQVSAIYETNTYYEGGAVMAKWEGTQKDAIMALSPRLVYSGAYVQAADYQQCKNYLEKQYKPYGRLKDRSEFATQEAYDLHYNAFMSATYANEITDFSAKSREAFSRADAKENTADLYTVLPCILIAAVLLVYSLLMWMRKSEKGYFLKRKIRGGNFVVYYLISVLVQATLVIFGMVVANFVVALNTSFYIPSSTIFKKSVVFLLSMSCISIIIAIENMILVHKIRK